MKNNTKNLTNTLIKTNKLNILPDLLCLLRLVQLLDELHVVDALL